jgi:hypothetical protein
MDTRLHSWFIAGFALAAGAVVGRWLPHLLFCCFVIGCFAVAVLGIIKTLKRWDR